MKLAWGSKVSPEFRNRVLQMCTTFNWSSEHPSWVMACIAFETASTFSPSIRNAAGSGAVGLIQFMPDTAEELGTTTDALAAMTAVQQLDYVEKYFKPYASKITSLNDMYMAILFPRAVGKPDDYILFSEGGASYRQNAGLDTDKDSKITKAEAASRVQAQLVIGLKPGNVFETTVEVNTVNPLAISILSSAIPKIITNLPEIANIFKNPNVAERNVEAISKVGTILMDTTKATNIQEAVERVQADPQTAAEVNSAIRMSRADIMDTLAVEDKRVEAARNFYTAAPLVIDTKWIKLKFVEVISLILLALGGFAAIYVLMTSKDQTERGMALQALILTGFGATVLFWLGSSRSSQIKDEKQGIQ